MIKQFAKYMKAGKTVESSWTGEVFVLTEDMDSKKGSVKAVALNEWDRYTALDKTEGSGFELTLKIGDVKPCNVVRFLRPDGEPWFEVKDLDRLRVDGSVARVVYLDAEHFSFVDDVPLSGCFEVHMFAAFCEKNGIEIEPFVQPFIWSGR